jgi:hypothetical protein
MPTRSIEHHDDLVLRAACAKLIEKYLHAPGIDVGQDQGFKYATERLYGSIGVGIFVSQHALT